MAKWKVVIFMYEVYVGIAPNFELLYEDTSMAPVLAVIDPTLILEEGKAGNFRCTVPPGHPLRESLKKRETEVRIYKRGHIYWYGQILDVEEDIFKQRTIVAEGPLAYLNNTMAEDHEYNINSQNDITSYVAAQFNHHNLRVIEKVSSSGVISSNKNRKTVRKQVYFGTNYVTTDSSIKRIVPNLQPNKIETSIDKSEKSCLEELTSTFGGYFYQRFGSTVDDYGETMVQIDYMPDYINQDGEEVNMRPESSQVIVLGQNLINLTQSWATSDICTVIHALGADVDGEPLDGGYIPVSEALIEKYGWIEKTVKWSDIENPMALNSLAKRYAINQQFITTSGDKDIGEYNIEITALDASYLDVDIDSFELSENVRVYSEYHEIDNLFPVQKMEIHMDKPEATVISLNTNKANRELSTAMSDIEEEVSSIDQTDYGSEIDDLSSRIGDMEDFVYQGDPPDEYIDSAISMSADLWVIADGFSFDIGCPSIPLKDPETGDFIGYWEYWWICGPVVMGIDAADLYPYRGVLGMYSNTALMTGSIPFWCLVPSEAENITFIEHSIVDKWIQGTYYYVSSVVV
jgi:hypothetical protein